jgi:hypothetical protein
MTGYNRGVMSDNRDAVLYVNDPNYDVEYYTASEVALGEASIYTVNSTLKCNTNTTKGFFKKPQALY